jgi:hypothetical protein
MGALNKKRMYPLFIFAAIFAVTAGCCAKCPDGGRQDGRVIAKINNYKLTADDFKDEARFVSSGLLSSDYKEKEDVINEIVTKKILLQEAQKHNYDKGRAFRKEIERYWEQALLKLLVKEKIDEFSRKIDPNIKDDTRHKMIQAELARWIADVRKTAKIKIYKENLEKIDLK